MPPSLSALIIAKDEETDLPGCLKSLKGLEAELVVLVDTATTDATETLAREAGAKVSRRVFDDYARQRQAALELCAGEWVLWIDADERLTPELSAAVAAALKSPEADAYKILFAVEFMGQTLRFGGLGGETHVRLFRRKAAKFVGGALHEGLALTGPVAGPLAGRMRHVPYHDLSEYLSKLDRYTSLAARKKYEAGVRFRPWQHLVLPGELLKRLVLRLGFLDGTPGIVYACLSAYHHWLKYAKLKEMEVRG